jgi:membrane protein implicated in regulation of membrane protease activity
MNINKKNVSMIFLILGMTFLGAGIATNNTAFSWLAVVFVLLSLVFGGRWMRPRK